MEFEEKEEQKLDLLVLLDNILKEVKRFWIQRGAANAAPLLCSFYLVTINAPAYGSGAFSVGGAINKMRRKIDASLMVFTLYY